MKYILLIILPVMLTACASNVKQVELEETPTTIRSASAKIKISNDFCGQEKYTASNIVIYGCGQGLSDDMELSKSKAILSAKVRVADIISSSIIKNETSTIKENIKGVKRTHDSSISNDVLEQQISLYRVVDSMVLLENGKYLTFVMLEYPLEI